MQKSASIQERTSPPKFDHFRYPKPDFTASDLSTKGHDMGDGLAHEIAEEMAPGLAQDLAHPRVERFSCRATVTSESLGDQNSVRILSEFRKCC